MSRRRSDWTRVVLVRDRVRLLPKVGEGWLPVDYENDLLGCGVFGCVYSLPEKKLVLKVTSDGSEAFLAEVALRSGNPPGLCAYSQPIRTSTPAGNVWLVWRERVEDRFFYKDVRQDAKELSEAIKAKCETGVLSEAKFRLSTMLWRKGTPLGNAAKELELAKSCSFSLASAFATAVATGKSPWHMVRRIQEAIPWAEANFVEPRDSDLWPKYSRKPYEGEAELALNVLCYRYHLGRAAAYAPIAPMCETLLALVDQGVMACDLNADNIAWLRGHWRLFDGGFTIPIDERWRPLWEKVGADSARWFHRGAEWEKILGAFGMLTDEEAEFEPF